jgi:hypothetical protein
MADPKVSRLGVVPAIPGSPNERIIQLLREALKEARDGKVQGIGLALTLIEPGGDGGRSCESIIAYTDGWAHSTSAAVSGLWMRMHYERYAQGTAIPTQILGGDADGESDP